ncbi:MAG: D-alanyl-D-alanine carboxypeptidase/D-alanyl-D-alanine-endopeptidase [Rhodobacteraceae bacterium]|nr:D-alanyl-D-alanine carboxypeptidase/D-alanyl-D-alanine-endopeptidase [Paracoccaceae bacterium]
MLAGLLAGVAGSALAEAPATSPRPEPRPFSDPGLPAGERLIEAAKLGGTTGFVVADAATGAILDAVNPDALLPPASVAKTITALYALEKLGADRRLVTRVLATGPQVGDRFEGDLILSGGGDPTLDTDDLGDLAAMLRKAGIRGVTGRFLAHAGALPALERIAADQPDQVGYNPGLSGLILNFGRVYFEWKRAGDGYAVSMDARGERFAPKIALTRMDLADRQSPLFTYRLRETTEDWTVARPALGKDGSRWLPVRRAAPYVAEAFRGLCAAQGITLPKAEVVATLPGATRELARLESEPLAEVLRGMLRWSTNITAEAVGLAASGAGTLIGSGRTMTDWAQRHLGHPGDFVDHSGLGSASRVTAAGMVRALIAGRASRSGAALPGILREVGMRDDQGKAVKGHPVSVLAKTGTLNFVSGLAGFIRPPAGRELAFAIFSADPARRAALPMEDRESPPGGEAWLKRARRLQGQLISRWAESFV